MSFRSNTKALALAGAHSLRRRPVRLLRHLLRPPRDDRALVGQCGRSSNQVVQMVDPWPPYASANRNIAFNGERDAARPSATATGCVIPPVNATTSSAAYASSPAERGERAEFDATEHRPPAPAAALDTGGSAESYRRSRNPPNEARNETSSCA